MENTYTINDLIEITGLKEKFIRNCIESLKDNVLKDSIKRGNKNSLLFDSNTLKIFDFIKQRNESGFSISSIKEELLQENLGKQKKETEENIIKTEPMLLLIDELKNMNSSIMKTKDELISKERELYNKDKEIIEKENVINHLKSNLKLLTDGKSPEEFIQEQIKQKEILMKIEFENNNNKEKLQKQYSQLVTKDEELNSLQILLKNKDSEYGSKIYEMENNKKLMENKRNEIIEELKTIEGKFFMGKKRKNLLNQLQELS